MDIFPEEEIVDTYEALGLSCEEIKYAVDKTESSEELADFLDGAVKLKELRATAAPTIEEQFSFYLAAKENGVLDEERRWVDGIEYIATMSEIYSNVLPSGLEFTNAFVLAKNLGNPWNLRRALEGIEQKMYDTREEDYPDTVPIPVNSRMCRKRENTRFESGVQSVMSMFPENIVLQAGYRDNPEDSTHFYEHLQTKTDN